MVRLLLAGANGHMGKTIASIVANRDDCKIVAGFDKNTEVYDSFPIFEKFDRFDEKADVLIDFSHPSLLPDILKFVCDKKIPAVICTTGLSSEQVEKIKEASKIVPIFFSANMSIGINLLVELAKKATAVLGDYFDIEIVEKHHNQKLDAPSGTALMIANAINDTMENSLNYVYDRHSVRKKREKNELGIHAIRGGTIVGEHDVIFAGRDEVITLSHSASSKSVFAVGSINAAIFLNGKSAGLYNMSDMI